MHARQRRACVGHLAQSSRPQTVSAVWARDQRPAEKWSGQDRTSRTGDAASVIYSSSSNTYLITLLLGNTHISFLCFVSYYIPDLAVRSVAVRCSSKVVLSNTCSVELPGGGVVSMNNVILAKWRIALSIN